MLAFKTVSLPLMRPGLANAFLLGFIENMNIYISGMNLVTWTRYLGYDPEFSYADGVLGQGIDYGKIPQPRSMVIGLKIGL